ncbi:MAG: magnesium transporter [Candidatus Sumerlaeales bacterium]|nr:magnesium transporter [Candidatus Sumerlaeales bacterium]
MTTVQHRIDEPWIELEEFVKRGSRHGAEWFVTFLTPSEVLGAVGRLSPERRRILFSLLSDKAVARILDILFEGDYQETDELLHTLSSERLAQVTRLMRSNNTTTLVGTLTNLRRTDLFQGLSDKEETLIRLRITFPENTAGSLMINEYLSYDASRTIGEVLRDLRAQQELYAEYDAQYIFVTEGKDKRLYGVVSLRDLVFSSSDLLISDLSHVKPNALPVMADIRAMQEYFENNSFLAAPVIDSANQLLGIVLRSDVRRLITQQREKSFMKFSGFIGGEENRSMSLMQRGRKRLSFLVINVLLASMACSVISMHEGTLSKVISLAVFLTVISNMCCCSGQQSVAVSIREMTLGLLRPREIWRVISKEFPLGVLLGLFLGLELGLIAWLWKGSIWLGIVVGGALFLNTLISCVVGGVVPLAAARFKLDPALVTSPVVTFITDLCGFMIALGLAVLMMPLLTA